MIITQEQQVSTSVPIKISKLSVLKVNLERDSIFGHEKSHLPFLDQILYPGVFYFENLNFGTLF